MARLNGVVPLAASMDRPAVRALLPHRTVLLIEQGTRPRRLAPACSRPALARRDTICCCWSVDEEVAHVHNLRLDPLPTEMLVGAVRPPAAATLHRPAIARCAARARGLPGRFASLLRTIEPCSRRVSVAAERRSIYAVDAPTAVDAAEPRGAPAWPVDGDVAAHRRRLTSAVEQLRSGRRAAAVRAVRGLACGLARRHDWRSAADGMTALAGALLKRGQLREASAALDDARRFAQQRRRLTRARWSTSRSSRERSESNRRRCRRARRC